MPLEIDAIGLRFNPRAREGRDDGQGVPSARRDVSIHAPARGATADATVVAAALDVSIHAPARGATCRQPD